MRTFDVTIVELAASSGVVVAQKEFKIEGRDYHNVAKQVATENAMTMVSWTNSKNHTYTALFQKVGGVLHVLSPATIVNDEHLKTASKYRTEYRVLGLLIGRKIWLVERIIFETKYRQKERLLSREFGFADHPEFSEDDKHYVTTLLQNNETTFEQSDMFKRFAFDEFKHIARVPVTKVISNGQEKLKELLQRNITQGKGRWNVFIEPDAETDIDPDELDDEEYVFSFEEESDAMLFRLSV